MCHAMRADGPWTPADGAVGPRHVGFPCARSARALAGKDAGYRMGWRNHNGAGLDKLLEQEGRLVDFLDLALVVEV